MSNSKRIQIMLSSDEYRELVRVADQNHLSVSELIQTAVRERYLEPGASRKEAIDRILGMNLGIEGSWQSWEQDVEKTSCVGRVEMLSMVRNATISSGDSMLPPEGSNAIFRAALNRRCNDERPGT